LKDVNFGPPLQGTQIKVSVAVRERYQTTVSLLWLLLNLKYQRLINSLSLLIVNRSLTSSGDQHRAFHRWLKHSRPAWQS